MLRASVERIVRELPDDAVVLDIGGAARPFLRADWVMDLAPYEERGMLGDDGGGPQRFSCDTWIERDICAREPYPFGDGQLDFVVCSHTLEDIRDPVWVCSEMSRIANAGYIEVPSRLEEQTYGFQGDLVGWGHHRWLSDVGSDRIEFFFKSWRLRAPGNHFPRGFRSRLSEEERISTLWWEGSFECGERLFLDRDELDEHLSGFVSAALAERGLPVEGPLPQPSRFRRLRRLRRRADQRPTTSS